MAKPELKGTTEEREQFMYKVFEKHYSDPEKAKKDLSVNDANKLFKAEFGTMLRNKKAYQLRDAVKAKLGLLKGKKAKEAAKNAPKDSGKNDSKPVTQAARPPQDMPVAAVAAAVEERGASLISGSPEQLKWFAEKVLPKLKDSGLLAGKLDYSTDRYAVVAPN